MPAYLNTACALKLAYVPEDMQVALLDEVF